MLRSPSLLAVALLASALSPALHAQCEPKWASGFGAVQPNNVVNVAVPWTHAGETEMYVGGDFTQVGGVPSSRVARWSPSAGWSNLGAGMHGPIVFSIESAHVHALAVFDDGSGPAIYAGGQFQTTDGQPIANIARWNGTAWSAVGDGLTGDPNLDFVYALAVYDDGSGPKLYAGGNFSRSGATPISKIARWDGVSWTSVGGGITGQPGDAVYALAVYTDPASSTSRLYAGGSFPTAGGLATPGLARWDGSAWSLAGGGANGIVRALHVHDDGSGSRLYAGGTFTVLEVSANRMARWDGAHWSAIGAGSTSPILTFGTLNATTGPQLYVAGTSSFHDGSTLDRVARIVGDTLVNVAGGPRSGNDIRCLSGFDAGTGPKLYVGGQFSDMDSCHAGYGTLYDGSSWSLLGGRPGGTNGQNFSCASAFQTVNHPAPIGRRSYVGGNFDTAGSTIVTGLARLDDEHWTSIGELHNGAALGYVSALCAYDFGNGPELVVGGTFRLVGGATSFNVARYDGQTWRGMGYGLPGGLNDFVVHDAGLGAGPELFACGVFTLAGQPHVMRWNGTDWSTTNEQGLIDWTVTSMASYDDGTGPALYAAFNPSGSGAPELRIVRWNGVQWSPTGFGLATNDTPKTLEVFDAGSGPRLYAGTYAGACRVWNGSTWDLAFALSNGIDDLEVFDDGTGPQLYVGGSFFNASTPQLNFIRRWNGSVLSPVGGGVSSGVRALGVMETTSGRALYASGIMEQVTNVGGTVVNSYRIARWGSTCPAPGVPFCSGDGNGWACPCGNAGAPLHGCANSFDSTGAVLTNSGTPVVSADTLSLNASGVSNWIVTFLQGTLEQNAGLGSPFGDGLRCAGGSVIRLGTVLAAGNAAQYPGPGQLSVSVRGAIPLSANVTRTYQVWYRNSPSFCTPSTFNLTNGVRTFWAP